MTPHIAFTIYVFLTASHSKSFFLSACILSLLSLSRSHIHIAHIIQIQCDQETSFYTYYAIETDFHCVILHRIYVQSKIFTPPSINDSRCKNVTSASLRESIVMCIHYVNRCRARALIYSYYIYIYMETPSFTCPYGQTVRIQQEGGFYIYLVYVVFYAFIYTKATDCSYTLYTVVMHARVLQIFSLYSVLLRVYYTYRIEKEPKNFGEI